MRTIRSSLLLACLLATINTPGSLRAYAAPLPAAGIVPAAGGGPVHTFTNGTLRLELKDYLDHPFYWWPRTLLTYRVRFEGARVRPEQLSLIRVDSAGRVPFQLSRVEMEDGYLKSAHLSFFSDLPSGGTRVFELTSQPVEVPRTYAEPEVRVREEDRMIMLNSGAMRVRTKHSLEPLISGTDCLRLGIPGVAGLDVLRKKAIQGALLERYTIGSAEKTGEVLGGERPLSLISRKKKELERVIIAFAGVE